MSRIGRQMIIDVWGGDDEKKKIMIKVSDALTKAGFTDGCDGSDLDGNCKLRYTVVCLAMGDQAYIES